MHSSPGSAALAPAARQQGPPGPGLASMGGIPGGEVAGHPAAPGAPMPASPFALLVPGRPLFTDFRQLSENRFGMDFPLPGSCPFVSVTILRPDLLPPDSGAAVFYAPPPFVSWELVGVLIPESAPTFTVRSPWLARANVAQVSTLRLGVSIEPLSELRNLRPPEAYSVDHKVQTHFALAVAEDLYRFMASFDKKTEQFGDVLVVPNDVVDRWLRKFKIKYEKDAQFLK